MPRASVVMQSPGSRKAHSKENSIAVFSPSNAYLFSPLKSAPLSGCPTSAGTLFQPPGVPGEEVERLEQIFPRPLQQSGLATAPEMKTLTTSRKK